MGVAMGYTHVNTGDEGAETCTIEGHSSTAHWHEKDSESNTAEVKGIYAKVADKTINNMSNGGMKDIMDELTLGEVVDTTAKGTNPILKELSGVKVNELGTALNDMSMGVAMGYTHVNTGEEGAETCSTDVGQHWHDSDGNEVKGIYAKIADKKLSEMSSGGMNVIMKGLTMGDLVDSGLMTLENDDKYTLAILSEADDTTHSFTEDGIQYKCNLQGYIAYKALDPTTNSKDFFDKAHQGTDPSACLAKWRTIAVTDFMKTLLATLR